MSATSLHIRPPGVFTLDTRWSLIIPISIGAFIVIGETPFHSVAWSALIASVSCVLVFASARFKLYSFVTLAGFGHLVFYPIAAFSNLLLEYPVVREDLWESADLAMWGCAIGCVGLALGTYLSRRIRIDTRKRISINTASSMLYNCVIYSCLPVAVVLMLILGVYYHGAISSDFQFKNAIYLNALNILNWIGYTGIFLQVRRYYITKSKLDAVVSVLMVFFAIVMYVPSGSRGSAILFLPLLIPFLFNFEKNNAIKVMLLSVAIIVLIVITVVLGYYRDMHIKGLSEIKEGYSAIEEASVIGLESKDASLALTVNRFSDFVATGRIIDYTPKVFPYRGLEGVFNWWQMFVPGFLRPDLTIMYDGAIQTDKYGVSPPIGASTPVMIIGDLFSRGGWILVFVGMVFIGYLLGLLDNIILIKDSIFSVVFFVLYGRGVYLIYCSSLLDVFILLSREFILMYLLSYILYRLSFVIIRYNNKTHYNSFYVA